MRKPQASTTNMLVVWLFEMVLRSKCWGRRAFAAYKRDCCNAVRILIFLLLISLVSGDACRPLRRARSAKEHCRYCLVDLSNKTGLDVLYPESLRVADPTSRLSCEKCLSKSGDRETKKAKASERRNKKKKRPDKGTLLELCLSFVF